MKKQRKHFTDEFKRAAIAEYVSSGKSAAEVAAEYGVTIQHLYKWKVQISEKDKGLETRELESSGRSFEDIKFIRELQAERDAYQKTVGEQTVIIELLKKRLRSTNSQQRSELTGLIETLEKSVQKQKREK